MNQKELKEILDYNPKTGIFIWKIKPSKKVCINDTAGCKDKQNGYIQIVINRRKYLAHRLAYLYVKGYMPKEIDHKDRIKYHNWFSNLRKITRLKNQRNIGNLKTNTSGIKGVYWHNKRSKWYVYLKVKGNRMHLGSFEDFDKAVLARYNKETDVGWEQSDPMSPAHKYCLENGLIPILVKVKKKFMKMAV